jgi:DNA (cytosine-5)-methyltransferase 1
VTIDELKRLCGFPDDFQLTRHWRKQWERLARSVPPPCMMHLSREMAGSLGA